MTLDYLPIIAANSERLASVAGEHLADGVPACPGWTGRDLLEHITQVQRMWAYNTRRGGAAPDQATRPSRDPDADPVTAARAATQELLATFADVGPDAVTYVWWNEAQRDTVFQSMRRQAHEATMHRVDAEQTAGVVSQIDAIVAADGIGEFFERMLDRKNPIPGAGDSALVEVLANDVGQHWFVTSGPSGFQLEPEPIGPISATITAPAAELYVVLWRRRGWHDLAFDGDLDTVEDLLSGSDLS